MMNNRALPHGAVPDQGPRWRTTTTNGTFDSSRSVNLRNVKLPDFGNTSIGDIKAGLFDSPGCRYEEITSRVWEMDFSVIKDKVTMNNQQNYLLKEP